MSFKRIKTELLVLIVRLLMKLPIGFLLGFGRVFGKVVYFLPNKRKKIARINLQLCFPKLNKKEIDRLLKKNLIATGQGLIEKLLTLWCPPERYLSCVEFSGLQHLQERKSQYAPILLSCHTTSIEFGARCLNEKIFPVGHMLMRQDNNKFLEKHMNTARERFAGKVIDKKDMRSLLKSLAKGHPVFYAADQNFSYGFEYIPFFTVPAATTIALAKLTHAKNITVIPWFCFRTGKKKWRIDVLPAASFFGDENYVEVLAKMNQLFENAIEKYPEQYLWVHRRFKNHPKGKNYLYKNI